MLLMITEYNIMWSVEPPKQITLIFLFPHLNASPNLYDRSPFKSAIEIPEIICIIEQMLL